MPFTIFHYPLAWGLSRVDKRLSLPALVVGAVMPDIEVPFLIIFFRGILPDHYILHSLIGSLTIGLILTVIVTRYIYPVVISVIFGVDREALNEACRVNSVMILSCAIGLVSHLLLDYPMHPYSQIFWPFIEARLLVGPLLLFFAQGTTIRQGFTTAHMFTVAVMVLWWIAIFVVIRKNVWEEHWMGRREAICDTGCDELGHSSEGI
ncbi:MAG: DUF4184 family protein [Candidatus Thorarchaeota archaeon]